MFYIHKHRTYLKRGLIITHLGPVLVVFGVLMGLTLWSWASANRVNQQELADKLTHSVGQTSATLRSRLELYDNMLRSSAGLVNGSQNLSPQQWEKFTTTFDMKQRYPGITTIGYGQIVEATNITSFGRTRQQVTPAYRLHPAGNRSTYAPIVSQYQASDATDNLGLGYDMYSDPVKRSTLEAARDTGTATITPPVRSRQATPTDQSLSLTLFMPLYAHGNTPETQEARQTAMTGFVYLTFRPQTFINHVTTDDNTQFGFQIYDATESIPLYENTYDEAVRRADDVQTLRQTIPVEDRQWRVVGSTNLSALSRAELRRPSAILWGGTLLSVLVAGSMYLLLLNRARLLANHEAGKIQEAKDELLALASHQLRTPATGVKQYIGMLREGYAGPLTTEQQDYVDKAYNSNERQLGTINDMLVVAKADAGHLGLNKTTFDLNQLVEEIIEEATPSITARQQIITSYMPSQHVHLHADKHFLRMAIENIINNATKYTPEGGTITVTVLRKKGKLSISVRDTGVGVRRGDAALLFQKFSRIPNELTSKVGGSGIGLYLAQKIVERHDGKITYKSAPDEGSVFTIIIPEVKDLAA